MRDEAIGKPFAGVREDCCDLCGESDRAGGCRHVHRNGQVGLVARCCPPGTSSKAGCEGCWPCDGFHLRGKAYFAADRLFKERDRFRLVRYQRPYSKRKHSHAQNLSNAIDRAENDWGERS